MKPGGLALEIAPDKNTQLNNPEKTKMSNEVQMPIR